MTWGDWGGETGSWEGLGRGGKGRSLCCSGLRRPSQGLTALRLGVRGLWWASSPPGPSWVWGGLTESSVRGLRCLQRQCWVPVQEGWAPGSRPLQALELQASFSGPEGGVPGNRESGEAPPLQALAVAGIWAAEGTDEVPEAILSIWCLAPPGPSFGDLGRLFLICERGALPFKC